VLEARKTGAQDAAPEGGTDGTQCLSGGAEGGSSVKLNSANPCAAHAGWSYDTVRGTCGDTITAMVPSRPADPARCRCRYRLGESREGSGGQCGRVGPGRRLQVELDQAWRETLDIARRPRC
jgi:hypothetical protein